MQKRIIFTKAGFEDLIEEEKKLRQERPEAVSELSKARAMGDLSENGYYKSARFKLSDIDRRLRELKHLIRFAQIKETTTTEWIDVGSKVTIRNGTIERIFQIVGGYESDPRMGKISIYSPLGKALHGKRKNEKVDVTTPQGTVTYIILQIE